MAWQGRTYLTLLRLGHGPTYLLRGHGGITVHAVEDGRLRLPVGVGGILGHLRGIHARLRAVVLLLGERVVPQRGVLGQSHVMLWRRRLAVARVLLLRRDEGVAGRRGGRSALARRPFRRVAGGFFARDDVDQEVEHVGFGQGRGDVGPLQCPPLVFLGVDPCSHGELGDEDVAPLGEQDGSLGRNHLHLRIGLHDLLDPGQGQLVDFIVMGLGLESMDGLLPVSGQNIAIIADEALIDLSDHQSLMPWLPAGYTDTASYIGPSSLI